MKKHLYTQVNNHITCGKRIDINERQSMIKDQENDKPK